MSRNLFLRWWKSLTSSSGAVGELRPVKKASLLCWDYVVNVVTRMEFSAVVLVKVIEDKTQAQQQQQSRPGGTGASDTDLIASKRKHKSESPEHTKRFGTVLEACQFLGLAFSAEEEAEALTFFRSRKKSKEAIECRNVPVNGGGRGKGGGRWQVDTAHSTSVEVRLGKVLNNLHELLEKRIEVAADLEKEWEDRRRCRQEIANEVLRETRGGSSGALLTTDERVAVLQARDVKAPRGSKPYLYSPGPLGRQGASDSTDDASTSTATTTVPKSPGGTAPPKE